MFIIMEKNSASSPFPFITIINVSTTSLTDRNILPLQSAISANTIGVINISAYESNVK